MTTLRKVLPFTLLALVAVWTFTSHHSPINPQVAYAQSPDCSFTFRFTGAATQTAVSNLSGNTPCVNWRLTVSTTGNLSATVTFYTSPDASTWTAVPNTVCSSTVQPPCVLQGANPIVGTQGMLYAASYGSYVQVVVTSPSGTGTGTVRGYGAKGASAAALPGSGGGGIAGLTTGTIPEATSATSLGDSPITDHGTTVTVGGGRNLAVGNTVLCAAPISTAVTTLLLTSAHNGCLIQFSATSAISVTVPTGLPPGFTATLLQLGSGGVVTPAASGTTFTTSAVTNGIGSSVSLQGVGTNTYVMSQSASIPTIATAAVLQGSGGNAIAAGAAQIVSLFGSGTCSGFLKSDGTCATSAGVPVGDVNSSGVLVNFQSNPIAGAVGTGNYFWGGGGQYNSGASNYNIAMGKNAMFMIGTGSSNTGIGNGAGYNISSGGRVTAVGDSTCQNTTTGSYNTCIGASADVSAGAGSYRTVIGAGASGAVDNSVTLGRSSDALVIPGTHSTTGVRFLCVDSLGNVTASATACVGT